MDYKISVSQSKKYILVDVFVSMTRKLALEIAQEADKLGVENDIHGLLYDLRKVKNIDDPRENFSFANNDFPKTMDHHFTRIVHLVDSHDQSHSMVVGILQDCGFNVRELIDEQKAIEWVEGS